MASSALGINADTIEWVKLPAFNHSAPYRQAGRDGNGHVVGPKYADPSTLRSTHFVVDEDEADTLLASVAAVMGTSGSVHVAKMTGVDNITLDVYAESFKPSKMNACMGPGSARFVVVLEWTVYMPVT